MKKKTNPVLTWLFLMFFAMTSSCSGAPLVPKLRDRQLRVCPDRAAFCYDYETCVKEVLGICFKKEWVLETVDLTDETQRKQMVDMGAKITFEGQWQ